LSLLWSSSVIYRKKIIKKIPFVANLCFFPLAFFLKETPHLLTGFSELAAPLEALLCSMEEGWCGDD
jgi:hypothetical protein